jgi:cold shock CspA family protein
MRTGIVKLFDSARGCGFIQPDDGSREVIFNIRDCRTESAAELGAAVMFKVARGRAGLPAAVDVARVRRVVTLQKANMAKKTLEDPEVIVDRERPDEPLDTEGVLTEDAELDEKGVKLVAKCGDIDVIGIYNPTTAQLAPGGLDHLKKGTRVRLIGTFKPTHFRRHKDRGIHYLKPIAGLMTIHQLMW